MSAGAPGAAPAGPALGPGARCAVIGAGRIGRAIAQRVAAAGHSVTAFDPDLAALRAARAVGAREAATPAAAVAGASVVLITVPDTADVHEAAYGPDGFEQGLDPGAIVVVMSTVAPATPVALASRLRRRDAAVLDAPLSGGPDRARSGTLTLMVGGSSATLRRCRPVLALLADRIVHVGPVGHGEIAKLANNLAGTVIATGTAEALSLAARAGADVARVAEAIGSGSGGSWILREWFPRTVLAGDLEPRFALALMDKDMRLVRELARELGVPVPAADVAHEIVGDALAAGHADRDFSVLAEFRASSAGTTLRLDDPRPEVPDT